MSETIELTDIKLDYVEIAKAREMSGLRIVLGAYAIPGPWREACKGVFHVKGLPYTPVATGSTPGTDLNFGMMNADCDLIAWTGQASAPVVVWNDERPRTTWIDQLYLAERLSPNPPLIPSAMEDRIRMFGLINEIVSEHGLGWSKRLAIIHATLAATPPGAQERALFEHFAQKYGYNEVEAVAAPRHMAAIMTRLDKQLHAQQDAGKRYFIGDSLSALDIYWAAFLGFFSPLPVDLCPMGTVFRGLYTNPDPETQAALSDRLVAHRDFIYREHLELPIVF